MTRTPFTCLWISACLAMLTGSAARSALPDNTNCLMCHSAPSATKTTAGKRVSVHVDSSNLRQSIHSKLKCVECHADLQDRPQMHGKPAPVQCARCHDRQDSHPDAVHAGIPRGKTAPACRDCHGSHDIKAAADPLSRVSRANSIGTCAKCHAGVKSLHDYRFSVHGIIDKAGRMPAAVCADCHRVHQPPTLGTSVDCMQCHVRQASEYRASSHGTARAAGDLNSPTCVDCHGGHEVLKAADPDSRVSTVNEPRQCGKCHNDKKLMDEYGLPADSLKTYRHSYHGKANLHGSPDAATCADCHNAHNVLPSDDPASATNPANLDETCAKCHPGVNMNVTKGAVHVSLTREQSALLYYVANGFKWLTIGTMVMLCGHIGLDLFSRVRRRLFDSLRRGR